MTVIGIMDNPSHHLRGVIMSDIADLDYVIVKIINEVEKLYKNLK